jgi:hypothetical protein
MFGKGMMSAVSQLFNNPRFRNRITPDVQLDYMKSKQPYSGPPLMNFRNPVQQPAVQPEPKTYAPPGVNPVNMYMGSEDQMFDDYVRRNSDLMALAESGRGFGNATTMSEMGRQHYNLHGKGEGRDIKKVGSYYDKAGKEVQPLESSGLQEILNSQYKDPEIPKMGLGALFPELAEGSNPTAMRNARLRPKSAMRYQGKPTYENDFIQYVKNNEEALNDFKVNMNLRNGLAGSNNPDLVRAAMENFGQTYYQEKGEGGDLPQKMILPEQKREQLDQGAYMENMRRLYQQPTQPRGIPNRRSALDSLLGR